MRHLFTLPVMLAVFFSVITFAGSAAVTTTSYQIYFQTDSFSLSVAEQQKLSDLVSQLSDKGENDLWVSGHTDAEGNSSYNRNLSQQRVSEVMRQLAALEVPLHAVHQTYYGEAKPVSDNNSESGKAKNRRVEITVKHTEINSMAELVNSDSLLAARHFVNAATGQTITGNKGMEITIPAGAFADANGREIKAGAVDVALTEYTNVADAFFHGVTSMSDKGLLQSGGMFYINATANGQPLQLKAGKELAVKIPSANPESDMKVYLAKTDGTGKMVWVETAAAFSPASQPLDTQKIKLARNKYDDFINAMVYTPDANGIPVIKTSTLKLPVKPVRPRLSLQAERTLTNSGIKYAYKNRKTQQRMLARMNEKIAANNSKRTLRYNQLYSDFIADSVAYPDKLAAYSKAKMEYADYCVAVRGDLDSLYNDYFMGVIKKRMQYYLKAVLASSEKGALYNSNLVMRLKNYCTTENSSLRDLSYERKLREAYGKATLRVGCYYSGYSAGLYYNAYNLYASLVTVREVKAILTSLVDDNPYLLAEERKLQKASIEKGSTPMAYTPPLQASYYAATIGTLGYVNCDRLYKQENVVAMQVDNLNKDAESVAFIKGLNASQNIYGSSNKFNKNEELRLLSVYFENGRPQVAYKEVKLNGDQKVDMHYKEMKAEEFKQLVLSFI